MTPPLFWTICSALGDTYSPPPKKKLNQIECSGHLLSSGLGRGAGLPDALNTETTS